MSKSKDRGHRETRTHPQAVPEVPDLGVLAMPRKSNRAAAKYVAAVGPFWDRRRVARVARRKVLRREAALAAEPRKQHLVKSVRKQLLQRMGAWSFDHKERAFVPSDAAPEHLEELLEALAELGPDPITLRVAELPLRSVARVRGYLPLGSHLVAVRPRLDAASAS